MRCLAPKGAKAWPRGGPETPPGHPRGGEVPYVIHCEPNTSLHNPGSLCELPLGPPCRAEISPPASPGGSSGQTNLLLMIELWMSPNQSPSKLPLTALQGTLPLSRDTSQGLGFLTQGWEILPCKLDVKMTLKNQLKQPLPPVHLLTYGLFRGRVVVIKPRAHKHHMRPVLKKIKSHVHKLRSCIQSYRKLTILPAYVPDQRNHWRDFFVCSKPHGTSFIKLLTSTTFTIRQKPTKTINTKPQVLKGGVWRLVPVSRQ